MKLSYILIYLNICVFIAELSFGDRFASYMLWAIKNPNFEVWQIFTYSFLHANLIHIFLNMLVLFMFGPSVEEKLGGKKFLMLYFFSATVAAFTQLALFEYIGEIKHPVIGASGAIYGLLLAFGVYFPKQIIILILPPIPMPARWFVIFVGAIEFYLGFTNLSSNVAHFAHIGGMFGASMLILLWSLFKVLPTKLLDQHH